MIFKSLAEDEVKATIARAREEVRIDRSKVREKLLDFYNGLQFSDEYLADYGFKKEDGTLLVPLTAVNLTKKIIDKISLVYKYAPYRVLVNKDGVEIEEDPYKEYIKMNPRFNLALKTAERRKNLLSKILFRPFYFPEQQRWKYFIETEYEPHFLDGDPLHPVAYSYLIKRNTMETNKSAIDEDIYVFWSDELYFKYDGGGRIREDEFGGVNPFSKIPFVEMLAEEPVDEYDENKGALTLMQANQAINVALNNINVALHYQSFDQPWASGVDEKQAVNLKVGPHRTLVVPEGSTMGLLGYSSKTQNAMDVIKEQLRIIAWTYNLTMNISMEGTPASGFSLLVQNLDLMESRHDDVDLAEVQEKEIYQVIRAQSDYYKLKPALIEADLRLDFREAETPISQAEELERWDWEIKNNAKSVIDYIMSQNPDMDEEEAEEKFNRNKERNKKFSVADKIREAMQTQGGIELPGGEPEKIE